MGGDQNLGDDFVNSAEFGAGLHSKRASGGACSCRRRQLAYDGGAPQAIGSSAAHRQAVGRNASECEMIQQSYSSFDAFWPDFLRAHSKPMTRAVHYAGMVIAIVFIGLSVVTGEALLLIPALLAPYVLGFASHGLIEGNQPVSLKHPVYSVRAAIRMFALWVIGRLKPELAKAGLSANTTM